MKLTNYSDFNFNVGIYEEMLTPEIQLNLCKDLLPYFKDKTKRTNILFGNEGLVYTTNYRGKTNNRKVLAWTEVPLLNDLRSYIQSLMLKDEKCSDELTVCVVQLYPNGKAMIKPHRDKEMVKGTRILGVSIGATREITFSYFERSHEISLRTGSMYVMRPPTNDKWLHSIPESDTKEPRLSLTFRTY